MHSFIKERKQAAVQIHGVFSPAFGQGLEAAPRPKRRVVRGRRGMRGEFKAGEVELVSPNLDNTAGFAGSELPGGKAAVDLLDLAA